MCTERGAGLSLPCSPSLPSWYTHIYISYSLFYNSTSIHANPNPNPDPDPNPHQNSFLSLWRLTLGDVDYNELERSHSHVQASVCTCYQLLITNY